MDAVELQQVVHAGRPLLRPDRLEHRERVVEESAATVEVEPCRVVLPALPAHTDTEVDPTPVTPTEPTDPTEPVEPRFPPYLVNSARMAPPVRLRLSVSASTMTATPATA